jgi:hypothetical protein
LGTCWDLRDLKGSGEHELYLRTTQVKGALQMRMVGKCNKPFCNDCCDPYLIGLSDLGIKRMKLTEAYN